MVLESQCRDESTLNSGMLLQADLTVNLAYRNLDWKRTLFKHLK